MVKNRLSWFGKEKVRDLLHFAQRVRRRSYRKELRQKNLRTRRGIKKERNRQKENKVSEGNMRKERSSIKGVKHQHMRNEMQSKGRGIHDGWSSNGKLGEEDDKTAARRNSERNHTRHYDFKDSVCVALQPGKDQSSVAENKKIMTGFWTDSA